MNYLKRIIPAAMIIACALAVNISQAADDSQEKPKACDFSYGLLLKAQPILEKGKPEDVAKLPDALKNLNGKRVRITGYLLIPSETYYLDKPLDFFAVSQNAFGCPCCAWGPPPTIFNIVSVKVSKGEEIKPPYSSRVTVEGVLKIEPKYEGGELVELYSISEATAKKKRNSIF